MTNRPIIPSRIIPAGQPIPTAPPMPPPPPGATDLPPWREPPAPPPPPPAAPPPGEVVVRHTVELVWAEPEPEPSRWARLWAWATRYVRPWQAVAAVAGALVPIPWTGYSVATTWAYTMSEARGMHVGLGYALAFGTFGLATYRLIRAPRLLPLFATVVTGIGTLGAIDLYDPVQILTGVRP